MKIKFAYQSFLLVITFHLTCFHSFSQVQWPKEIPFKNGGKAIIYQPQPESFEGNVIVGRSAVSVKETPKSEPTFGVIFYEAKISTDKNIRIATLESITITACKFTGIDDTAKLNKLTKFIESEVPKWNMEIPLDALVATIKRNHDNAEIYNNDPPKIIYTTQPSILVIMQGDPIIKKDTSLDADRVLNTPTLIFKEGSQWNMYNGGLWYKSAEVTKGWKPQTSMSKKVSSINDQIKKQEKENNGGKSDTTKPVRSEIIVATVPTELIQSKGTAVYKKIDSTASLFYVSNSTNNIFKDSSTGVIYILIAGRWFKSSSLSGPWMFNEPDKMPADFARIPEGSEKDVVLASISGTNAAEEAIIDAEIPQTAKVDRKTAKVNVLFDGTPQFKAIDGTSLERAENSNITVLKDSTGKYFALDNGVWFTGAAAKGPWAVATERPKGIEKIPMQNAAYNSKFVYIYEVTPEYTVQGYTGGYLGNYVQGDPVVVFGTGFLYPFWFGSLFFPPPLTWGFGYCYTPYMGWSMGYPYYGAYMAPYMAVGIGIGIGFAFGGWYGPPMYRPPYYGGGGYYGRGNHVSHYGNTNININNNIYRPNNGNINSRPGVSNRPSTRPAASTRPSASTRPANQPGAGNRPSTGVNNNMAGSNNRPNARPSNGSNNVYSDRSGNVYQRDKNNNVQQRDNRSGTWNNSPNNSSMNRDMQARDRGTQNYNNYNRQPQARQGGGGYGGGRGGGGGMRGGGGGGRRR